MTKAGMKPGIEQHAALRMLDEIGRNRKGDVALAADHHVGERPVMMPQVKAWSLMLMSRVRSVTGPTSSSRFADADATRGALAVPADMCSENTAKWLTSFAVAAPCPILRSIVLPLKNLGFCITQNEGNVNCFCVHLRFAICGL